jgi:hypothetical protein
MRGPPGGSLAHDAPMEALAIAGDRTAGVVAIRGLTEWVAARHRPMAGVAATGGPQKGAVAVRDPAAFPIAALDPSAPILSLPTPEASHSHATHRTWQYTPMFASIKDNRK